MKYHGKVVVVTGGANGIGRGIAQAYLDKGATVVFADLDEAGGKALMEQWGKEAGERARFYHIDLCRPEEIPRMFQHIIKQFGKVDILINNAGKGSFKPLLELTVEEWDGVIHLNLRAAFLTAREFARHHAPGTYGRIINIASTRYLMSEPHSEAYAASKGGIVALTHALALSLSSENLTVNAISPGWIANQDYDRLSERDHSQHPACRVGKPEDIVRACTFLTDEDNGFITGENLVVDGGMTKKMIYEE